MENKLSGSWSCHMLFKPVWRQHRRRQWNVAVPLLLLCWLLSKCMKQYCSTHGRLQKLRTEPKHCNFSVMLPCFLQQSHLPIWAGQEKKEKEEKMRRWWARHRLKLISQHASVSLPHRRARCTGTCSGVCRTLPTCLRSGCAASSGWPLSSRCRDATYDPCYETSARAWREACSLDDKTGRV